MFINVVPTQVKKTVQVIEDYRRQHQTAIDELKSLKDRPSNEDN
jgi:hypothetical protein